MKRNRWNIPADLEREVLARDLACVYCGMQFTPAPAARRERPSWEHIVNDASIITRENIALCCIGCNASKGAKVLTMWLSSAYCERRGISAGTVAPVVQAALMYWFRQNAVLHPDAKNLDSATDVALRDVLKRVARNGGGCVLLYHSTTHDRAHEIVRIGFHDGSLSGTGCLGVSLSLAPVDANEGAQGDAVIEIEVPSDASLRDYLVMEEGMPVWELLVPSDVVNAWPRRMLT